MKNSTKGCNMTVIFRGKPACECLAEWIPYFEAELKARGLIKVSVDIAQLIGTAEASASTHSKGGAIDIWQTNPRVSKIARQMGCIMWPRTTGSFAKNKHSHGVLRGCPHNGPARYQITAADAGYNGLGKNGRGGPDPKNLHAVLNKRTWKQGIEWHKREKRIRKINTRLAELRAEKAKLKKANQ
jgi:hypothetical protein